MTKPPGRMLRFAALPLLAFPVTLLAQAAAEYALKSGGGAGQPGRRISLAGCPVDSGLLTCLVHSYPETTAGIGIVICILLARWVYTGGGYSR